MLIFGLEGPGLRGSDLGARCWETAIVKSSRMARMVMIREQNIVEFGAEMVAWLLEEG